MGLFGTIAGAIGRGVGWLGNKVRKVGEFAGSVARRVGEFAPQIGASVGGLLGDNVAGRFVRGLGEKVGSVASTVGTSVSKGVSDIGASLSGIGRALTPANTNNGQKGA